MGTVLLDISCLCNMYISYKPVFISEIIILPSFRNSSKFNIMCKMSLFSPSICFLSLKNMQLVALNEQFNFVVDKIAWLIKIYFKILYHYQFSPTKQFTYKTIHSEINNSWFLKITMHKYNFSSQLLNQSRRQSRISFSCYNWNIVLLYHGD